ncbi:MAG TPA: DNA-processing protein DprA [Chondromyces sp.]|nr:DNA-processing protein DprA [Chondromyces sp.]
MEEITKKIIHLQHCGAGWKSLYFLLKHQSNLDLLYHYSPSQLANILSISPLKANKLYNRMHSNKIETLLSTYAAKNIHFIPFFDSLYPKLLLTIPQPPWMLYAVGNLDLLKSNKIAFVGARNGSDTGKRAIEKLLPPLLKADFVVVSGLARGIDTFVHQSVKKQKGRTIAVIAGGFFHIYPKENETLARELVYNDLLLSEYPPCTQPARWQFPARNRIISGLSLGTVVVQAGKRSGSLITAYYALEQGREVFAVPGPIDDPLAEGTNELITEGAKLVQNGEDILAELHPQWLKIKD